MIASLLKIILTIGLTTGDLTAAVTAKEKSKVIGGGSCVLYPATHPTCAGGCGPGPNCVSTWKYYGKGQSGGCAEGTIKKTVMSPGGVTEFECLSE